MYYNTIIQLIAGLTNVFGTSYAVLSILKATPIDLYKSITLKGIGDNDKTLLTRKEQARTGISLIVLAWIIQAVFSFIKIETLNWFIICLIACVGAIVGVLIALYFANKKFADKYYSEKPVLQAETNDEHSDMHKWGNF